MPVVVPAQGDGRLRQGDVIKACALHFSDHAPDAKALVFAEEPVPYLLVLSRDCRAVRDELISVAAIKKTTIPLKQEPKGSGDQAQVPATFERVLTVLTTFRDGGRNPDLFYLGTIENDQERYAADLRTPFVVRVPEDEVPRSMWILANRVARLDSDFIDHLHSRIFVSYARKGFDDEAWFPDADLRLLISHGEAEEAKLASEVRGVRAQALREQASGEGEPRVS